jgi:hypothetical protein
MGYGLLKSMLTVGLFLLFVQFWLGMNLNLFVSLPTRLPSDFFSYSGGDELLAHVVIGVTILVLASLILSYSSRLRNIPFSALSTIGIIFALVAPATGATLALCNHDEVLSLAMAMSFLIVFAVFLAEYFLLDRLKLAGYVFR